VTRERIITASRLVPQGRWTTYATISEVVYGHRDGARTVGKVIRADAHVDSSHRTLAASGKISPEWRGAGGGPEECVRRLRREGVWDDSRDRARPDLFIDAAALRQLGA
jgi:alkylated DNA nucleotide flippase Atl1